MKVYRIIPEFSILRQHFKADFLLKMLNSADNNSYSYLVSVYLKVVNHLTWIFFIFWRHTASLNSDFLRFRIL